jgi:cobalt/nickel transport system ATP-binding protein
MTSCWCGSANGPTSGLLADEALMVANRLELPFGFDPAAARPVRASDTAVRM